MMVHKTYLPVALCLLLSAVACADGQDDIVYGSDSAVSANSEQAEDPHKDEVDSLAFGNYYTMDKYSSVQEIIRKVGEPVGSSVYIPRETQKSAPAAVIAQ
jgi:hypothetical protein